MRLDIKLQWYFVCLWGRYNAQTNFQYTHTIRWLLSVHTTWHTPYKIVNNVIYSRKQRDFIILPPQIRDLSFVCLGLEGAFMRAYMFDTNEWHNNFINNVILHVVLRLLISHLQLLMREHFSISSVFFINFTEKTR